MNLATYGKRFPRRKKEGNVLKGIFRRELVV